jgi:ribosomal protein L37E
MTMRKKCKIKASFFICPQAGQAFTFFLQQKKVNKKCRRCGEKAKNLLRYAQSVQTPPYGRQTRTLFNRSTPAIFFTLFLQGGKRESAKDRQLMTMKIYLGYFSNGRQCIFAVPVIR